MAMAELERLVEDAECEGAIRRSLRRCRSRAELVLAARRLGYSVHRLDLRQAWLLHCQECARNTAAPEDAGHGQAA